MRNGGCGVPDGGTVWPCHFSGLARLRFCEALFVSFFVFGMRREAWPRRVA